MTPTVLLLFGTHDNVLTTGELFVGLRLEEIVLG